MRCTMAGGLALMRSHLGSPLVSDGAFEKIFRLAGRLPPVYWGGLECHLGDGPDHVDFHQGFHNPGLLEEYIRSPAAKKAMQPGPIGGGLKSFAAQWALTGSPFHRHVNRISLEFDAARPNGPIEVPSVFLFLAPFLPMAKVGELRELIAPFLSVLTSTKVPAGIYKNVEKLAEAKDNAAIGHLGAMASRKRGALRVVLVQLTRGGIIDTISRLRPAKEMLQIEPILATLEPHTSHFALTLDILPEAISPRYGIESHPEPTEDDPEAWRQWIHRFTKLGFCSYAQAEALVRWPGLTTPADTDVPWPADLINASLRKRTNQFTCFSRYINHLKIGFSAGEAVKAKAYLGFIHDWLEPKRGPSPGGPMGRARKTT